MRGVKVVGRRQRLECGCVTDDIQYHDWCDAHRREHEEIHARWNEEHRQELLLAEERS